MTSRVRALLVMALLIGAALTRASNGRWERLRRDIQFALIYRNWAVARRNRQCSDQGHDDVLYTLRSGNRFVMQTGPFDVCVLDEIWCDRVYEPSTEFRIQRGWTILDLGAHKGAFSIQAALAAPDTTVIAVEPESENARRLRQNLEINRLSNVHVHQAAIAPISGDGLLYISGHSWAHTTSTEVGWPSDDCQSVPTLSLADLIASIGRPIDLLKMDIEGAEVGVLRSLDRDTFRNIRRLIVECHGSRDQHPTNAANDLLALLNEHGYQCQIMPGSPAKFAMLACTRPDSG